MQASSGDTTFYFSSSAISQSLALQLVEEALWLKAAVEQQLCPRLLLLLSPLELQPLLLEDNVDVYLYQIEHFFPPGVLRKWGKG